MAAEHRFLPGDRVTIFQMHGSKGLLIEGPATIVKKDPNVSEYYVVRFDADTKGYKNLKDAPTYLRFVDTWGQDHPEKYASDFNKKIGYPRED